MPEENSNMDEVLKAYAKKRREEAGAPLELHPATRRMLQGEVKRTLGKTEIGGAKAGVKFSWWTILSLGSATVIAALLFMPTLQRGKSKGMPAVQTAALEARETDAGYAETASARQKTDQPVLSEAPAAGKHEDLFARSAGIAADSIATATINGVSSLSTNSVTASLDDFRRADRGSDGLAKLETRSGAVGDTSAAQAKGGERAEVKKAVEEELSFVQQPSGKSQGQASSQVLTRFQFSQNGTKVRITDADGSVYDGTVLAEAGQKTYKDLQTGNEKQKAFADKEQATENALALESNIAFKVSGTNRQIKQVVSFTGNLLNNALPAAAIPPTQQQNRPAAQNAATQGRAIFNSIQGTVNVGGTNEFELNAVQTGQ